MSLKVAFDYSPDKSVFGRMPGNPSIQDLLLEIRNDPTLSLGQQLALTAELNSATGNLPKSTPLGVIGSALFGATVANLVARYFGMGAAGRSIATLAGLGLGSSVYGKLRDNGIPGWDPL